MELTEIQKTVLEITRGIVAGHVDVWDKDKFTYREGNTNVAYLDIRYGKYSVCGVRFRTCIHKIFTHLFG